ncbi:hypothetical protein [Subtercola sp. YIM 133946]
MITQDIDIAALEYATDDEIRVAYMRAHHLDAEQAQQYVDMLSAGD